MKLYDEKTWRKIIRRICSDKEDRSWWKAREEFEFALQREFGLNIKGDWMHVGCLAEALGKRASKRNFFKLLRFCGRHLPFSAEYLFMETAVKHCKELSGGTTFMSWAILYSEGVVQPRLYVRKGRKGIRNAALPKEAQAK
jgi:hypothetical protein